MKFKGVFGSMAPHGKTAEEMNKVTAPQDAFIDVGVLNKQEAIDLGIRKGDQLHQFQNLQLWVIKNV